MELLQPKFNLAVWGIACLIVFLLWLIALVSVLQSNFKDSVTKLTWVVVIIFLPVLGSLLYFFMGLGQRITNNQL
ncbi:PLDc N-terminal domain-containing protein [Ferruginibacter sp. SUN106]|uniref:PLDc N-terminal domain-containing protein n=1 Tax=Ferruginibacter sp. SUN106 TaxID=2978348 RepID=UPI003D3680F6